MIRGAQTTTHCLGESCLREPAEPRAVLWGLHMVKVVGAAHAAGEMAAGDARAAQN